MPDELPAYIVVEGFDRGSLEAEVAKKYKLGYVAAGGVSNGDRDGKLYQALTLRSGAPAGETKLREPKKGR